MHLGWERRDASHNYQVIYANDRNDSGTLMEPVQITSGGANKATPFTCVGKKTVLYILFTIVRFILKIIVMLN